MPGTIQGVVTAVGGGAIASATVTLANGASATTNGAGAYAITGLVPGTYTATVAAVNYVAISATNIAVANGGTTTRNFALSPMFGALQGTVSSSADSSLIPGATVALSNGGGSTTTDAAGHYAFSTLAPGTYTATVTAPPAGDPCKAANAFFGLGAASSYTLLGIDVAGCSGTQFNMGAGTAAIDGDVGIGSSVDGTITGGEFRGKLVVDPSGSYTVAKTGPVIHGGVSRQDLKAAVSAATAAAARLAKLTPTQKLPAITTSIAITGNGGINVVSIPSLKIVGGTITIRGTASDIFVFNVAGKFELDNSDVVLAGGVRACNILWNFTGTAITESNEVELENGASAAGIFLAMSRLVELDSSSLDGQVLAGGDIEVWGATITKPAGTATIAYDVLTVPGIVIPAGTTVTRNFALVPTDACRGANSFFGLGPANSYALLGIGVAGCSGTTIDMGASSTIGGDVGIGDSVDASLEGGTIEGRLVTDPSASYWIPRRGGTSIQGGVSKASLDDAVATATAAANRLAKLTATQKLSAATKSITITGNGGVNVVSIPSVKIVNGALTIHGSPSDIFVVNVAGKFELDSSDVVLDGGVRACNILWNFTGSAITESNEVELENGSTAAGVFLALSRLVDLEDSTLNGRVLAGGDLEVWTSTIRPPQ